MLQKFVKMTPTKKVLGRGKSFELTTFAHYEAFPELIDTSSTPAKELEIGTSTFSRALLLWG